MYLTLIAWIVGVAAAIAAVLYQLLLILIFCYQDLVVFPGQLVPMYGVPPQGVVTTERLALRNGREFRVSVARGKAPTAVVVWFVGNAGGILRCRYTIDVLARAEGFVMFSPEYPGFEPGSARPSKKACLECAELTAERGRKEAKKLGLPLIIGGHSLGTFMASHVAAKGYGARLMLISPPSSVLARGEALLPFMPIRYLLRENLDNLASAPNIRIPTMVLHAAEDRIVPVDEGRRVAAAIRGAKLVIVPGNSHAPIPLMSAAAAATREFLHGKH